MRGLIKLLDIPAEDAAVYGNDRGGLHWISNVVRAEGFDDQMKLPGWRVVHVPSLRGTFNLPLHEPSEPREWRVYLRSAYYGAFRIKAGVSVYHKTWVICDERG